jgi:hypothetical protein
MAMPTSGAVSVARSKPRTRTAWVLESIAIERGEPVAAGTLATQDCQLVTERNDLELQFLAAAKPTSEPRKKLRTECEHARDTTAGQDKSLDFSMLCEFSVWTTA